MKELRTIQCALNAPKTNYNSAYRYSYRSCEDILAALKPLLKETECTLVLMDEIVNIGTRYYVKATATLTNKEGKQVSTQAFAREAESKNKMDESQITGASSSYARKYALNGLFAIDDTKDADALNTSEEYIKKANTIEISVKTTGWKDELERARTTTDVEEIWKKHKELQGDEDFRNRISERFTQLKQ